MKNTLDLSKFPKITSEHTDISDIDSKFRILEERERKLREDEFDLSEKEKKVYALEADLAKQKEYIARANLDLKEKEEKVIDDKEYIEKIEVAKQEWENRKAEAMKQEKVVDEKLKALNKLKKEMDLQE